MPIVIVILIVLLGFMNQQLWLSPDAGRGKVRLLQDAIDVQTDENAKLAERNKTLEAEVLNLKDGLEAIEERARVELGMIRNGETFYHVLEEMPPPAAPVAAPKARRAVKPKATPARAAVKPRND